MSRMMRMAYGHGGTRLEHVLVSASHVDYTPSPRWLRVLLIAVWIIVPALVSLYAVPTARLQTPTQIDISKLTVKSPPEEKRPVIREVEQRRPVVKSVEPLPTQINTAPPAVQKHMERPTAPQLTEEVQRPANTRPSGTRMDDVAEYQPRIARERVQVSTVTGPSVTIIKRGTAVSQALSDRITITRTRGVVVAETPGANDRVAALRRVPMAEGPVRATGDIQRPIKRRERASDSAGTKEVGGPRTVAMRERGTLTGSAGGEAETSVGLSRGISLMSLEICSSPGLEEDDIKAVMSVVGSRQSCRDEKGEFQFKGTKRISSFNLMIIPAKGRRPSNRCEELEYAYKCLKNN